MLTHLMLLLTPLAEVPATPAFSPGDTPVRLWLNSNRTYRPGERVNVQVETGAGGYLFVLQYAPDGRVKVLFPVEPRDDAQVRSGRRYEVRDPGGDQSFVAAESGPGFVLAALAPDPWRFERATAGGAWDYGFLAVSRDAGDPEAALVDILQRLAAAEGFDYDVIPYVVEDDEYVKVSRRPGWWSPTYVTVYDSWYDPWYGCWSCGGIYIGIGDPYPFWWYRPWGYYSYRYRSAYYYPYGPYYPHYPSRPWGGGVVLPGRPSKIPAIIGRPRGYTVGEISPWGGRSRESGGLIGGGFRTDRSTGAGGSAEARPPARRSRDRADEVRRPTSGSSGAVSGRDRPAPSRPSARPADSKPQSQPAPARSRPRGGRDNESSAVPPTPTAPNVERVRGETPVIRWTRVEDDAPTARRSPQAESRPVTARSRPADRPEPTARRVERPVAERSATVAPSRPAERRAEPPRTTTTRSRPTAAPARQAPAATSAPKQAARSGGSAANGQSPNGGSKNSGGASGGRSRSRGN